MFDGTGRRRPRGSTTSVTLDHRYSPARASGGPLQAEQGSTLHRYSIGCSLSHTQSQCLGKTKKEKREITVFSARQDIREKTSLEWSLTVGPVV